MTPGPVEEAGKVATSTIDALKATPIVLALVIFNVIFMILTGYISVKSGERWDRSVERWQEIAEQALKACPGK